MFVIAGRSSFKHDFNRCVGIGSSSQCFDGADCMIFDTSDMDVGVNDDKCSPVNLLSALKMSNIVFELLLEAQRFLRIVSILFRKNSQNSTCKIFVLLFNLI
jgi:hypothetical protein